MDGGDLMTFYIVRKSDNTINFYTRVPRKDATETIELTESEWRDLMDALPHIRKQSEIIKSQEGET